MRALFPCFNRLVLEMAPAFEAKAIAPSTFAELRSSPRLIVWEGASDQTIYGDANVNHAFRAWHDSCHLIGGFDFTLAGERQAAELQIRQVLQRYPQAPRQWLDIIRAEVTAQAEYLEANGEFPADQLAFMRSILCHK